MRVTTWNINGIRATNSSSSMRTLLDSLQADIICLQETKITRTLLPEDIARVEGYHAFFSFSRLKGGYSGVVTYCRKSACPLAAEEGLTGLLRRGDEENCIGGYDECGFSCELLKSLDNEGRCVITEHKVGDSRCCVVNVYCPRADPDDEERYTYKMNFYSLLEARCRGLVSAGKHVLLVGDMNVSHKRIDHCDPCEDFEENRARIWWNGFLKSSEETDETKEVDEVESDLIDTLTRNRSDIGDNEMDKFVDTFRHFHASQKEAYTCWNTKTRARETNYGTRIDYVVTNKRFLPYITDCIIRPDVMGSDHCPVQCDININISASKTVPSLCATFMPELSGKQAGITSYFVKKNDADNKKDESTGIKRSHNFPTGGVAKCRKVQGKSGNKTMLNYFTNSKEKPSNKSCGSDTQKNSITETIRRPAAPQPSSDELWQSANYIKTDSKYKKNDSKSSWKSILKGPDPLPYCSGHNEKSVLRTVKKEGPNVGRQFYVCARPAGSATNKNASCDFFQWKN